jgi:hypothetical protein
MRMPVLALLRSLAASLIVAGSLATAGAVSPAAIAAPAPPAASCGHKVVQPFGLNALTDKQASALARLTPRQGCGLAPLPGMPGSPTAAAKGPRPSAITPRTAGTSNIINSVAATSATDAWAVGTTFSSSGGTLLIEHWDGSTWRVPPGPGPLPGTPVSELFSVTAISATNAWAVGTFLDDTQTLRALTVHWDGTQWSMLPSAGLFTTEAFLLSVSAVSASDVWAVGFSNSGVIAGNFGTLTEHWDGSAWTVKATPDLSPSIGELTSVKAISATNVLAVGYAVNSAGFGQTLAERWDGTQWTIVPSPNVGADSELFSLTATSATDAWAVGFSDDSTGVGRPLAEHWNGTAWGLVTTPAVSATFGELRSVTATSATNAWAVGDIEDASGAIVTVAERWNGTAWSVAVTPNPGDFDQLIGVAATSTGNAWAAGTTDGAFGEQTLAERWNGTAWKVAPSPNPGTFTEPAAVAATSATDAWAVGSLITATEGVQSLAEHWDGTAWSVVPTPVIPGSAGFTSVSATSATNAWAVGGFNSGTGEQLLAEHWDGTAWAISGTLPLPPGARSTGSGLASVKATSASNAWAVGSYQTADGNVLPLVERWDGTSWTMATTPATVFGWFNSVTATSATSAWAVGVTVSSGSARPLIEHWDGTAWSVATTPDPGSVAILTSVTATSATSALAVGSSGSLLNQQFAEQWNGTGWTVIPSTGTATTPEAVAATSAGNAWSVGIGTPQRWNGSAWTSVPVTNPLPGEIFFGVAATAASNAWAVGDYTISPNGLGSAIAHWNGTSWSPVPSP